MDFQDKREAVTFYKNWARIPEAQAITGPIPQANPMHLRQKPCPPCRRPCRFALFRSLSLHHRPCGLARRPTTATTTTTTTTTANTTYMSATNTTSMTEKRVNRPIAGIAYAFLGTSRPCDNVGYNSLMVLVFAAAC